MNATPSVRIGFVVPVYNGERFIARCLESLLAECHPDDAIVVVDNGSTDRTCAIVGTYPRVRLVNMPKAHIGALRNAGARLAGGDVFGFVDADCLLCRGWRAAVVAGLIDPAVAAVGSRYALPEHPCWIEKSWFAQKLEQPGPVNYINSGNLAVRSSAFDAVAGFDETLETGEDAELGWRLRAQGYLLMEIPAVRAVHLGNPKNLKGFYRKQRWHGLGMFGTFRVARFDKPLIMTIAYLLSLLAALGCLLVPQQRSAGAALLPALLLLLAVPAVTAAYRCVQYRQPKVYPQLLLLYLFYFTARGEAFLRLLLRAAGRSRQGA